MNCGICLETIETIETSDFINLICNHTFHKKCFIQYVKYKTIEIVNNNNILNKNINYLLYKKLNCPYCRKNINILQLNDNIIKNIFDNEAGDKYDFYNFISIINDTNIIAKNNPFNYIMSIINNIDYKILDDNDIYFLIQSCKKNSKISIKYIEMFLVKYINSECSLSLDCIIALLLNFNFSTKTNDILLKKCDYFDKRSILEHIENETLTVTNIHLILSILYYLYKFHNAVYLKDNVLKFLKTITIYTLTSNNILYDKNNNEFIDVPLKFYERKYIDANNKDFLDCIIYNPDITDNFIIDYLSMFDTSKLNYKVLYNLLEKHRYRVYQFLSRKFITENIQCNNYFDILNLIYHKSIIFNYKKLKLTLQLSGLNIIRPNELVDFICYNLEQVCVVKDKHINIIVDYLITYIWRENIDISKIKDWDKITLSLFKNHSKKQQEFMYSFYYKIMLMYGEMYFINFIMINPTLLYNIVLNFPDIVEIIFLSVNKFDKKYNIEYISEFEDTIEDTFHTESILHVMLLSNHVLEYMNLLNNFEIIKNNLKKCINIKNFNGDTPIHYALKYNDPKVSTFLYKLYKSDLDSDIVDINDKNVDFYISSLN